MTLEENFSPFLACVSREAAPQSNSIRLLPLSEIQNLLWPSSQNLVPPPPAERDSVFTVEPLISSWSERALCRSHSPQAGGVGGAALPEGAAPSQRTPPDPAGAAVSDLQY